MQGLDDVAVFVKVVQAGSFTQAARQLAMPNTTVSAKVAALERRLGVTLIQRTTRKLSVTQAGETYFRKCVGALQELESAEIEVTSSQHAPQGTLRLTAPNDFGQTLLPGVVGAFLKEYPQMQVDLLVTNRVVDLIAEAVDLAIRAGALDDSSLIGKKLLSGSLTLWASAAYLKKHGTPTHPRELARHEVLRFNEAEFAKVALVNGKERFPYEPRGRIAADDLLTLKEFALRGMGIGLFPTYLCENELRKSRLTRVLPQWLLNSGNLSVVYPAQKFESPKVRAFIEVMEKCLAPCEALASARKP